MKRSKRSGLLVVAGLILGILSSNAQILVESVAAIVGNEVIYLSDIENGVMDTQKRKSKDSGR